MDTYGIKEEQFVHKEPQQQELKRGWHMFYLLPIAYALLPYLFCFLVGMVDESDTGILSYVAGAQVVLGIVNIIVSIRFCKPENRLLFLNAAVIIKYTLIPLYILGGIVVLVAGLLSFIPVPFMIFVGPTMAFILGGIGWLILVLGSPYVIAYLRLSRKAGIRPWFFVIIHGILQFFFTIDVIDVMILAIRERKWIKTTVAIIFGLLIAVIAFAIWLIKVIAGM